MILTKFNSGVEDTGSGLFRSKFLCNAHIVQKFGPLVLIYTVVRARSQPFPIGISLAG